MWGTGRGGGRWTFPLSNTLASQLFLDRDTNWCWKGLCLCGARNPCVTIERDNVRRESRYQSWGIKGDGTVKQPWTDWREPLLHRDWQATAPQRLTEHCSTDWQAIKETVWHPSTGWALSYWHAGYTFYNTPIVHKHTRLLWTEICDNIVKVNVPIVSWWTWQAERSRESC